MKPVQDRPRDVSRQPARHDWRLLVVAALLTVAAACGHKIGDSCGNSADCDPSTGARTCDISQPGGYCIIEGCDARSCPSDSVCVRFFPRPPLLETELLCDPRVAATCWAGPTSGVCCEANEVCVPTAADGTAGKCVRATLEKRACVMNCDSNDDCRGGYICRTTGACGTLPLVLDPNAKPKYCAPATTAEDTTCAAS
ncbi:MAG TPA: hypothetical protein VHU40_03375 [Polyangia bacterium]|nr:hypothetical protein [Polyangia bacterium]